MPILSLLRLKLSADSRKGNASCLRDGINLQKVVIFRTYAALYIQMSTVLTMARVLSGAAIIIAVAFAEHTLSRMLSPKRKRGADVDERLVRKTTRPSASRSTTATLTLTKSKASCPDTATSSTFSMKTDSSILRLS